MITTIRKTSPRERLGGMYGNSDMWPSSPEINMRIERELQDAVYYPRIGVLNKDAFVIEKDCELTGRIKYSRGTNKHGVKNSTVDILIEISWQLSKRVTPARWFRTPEYEYETRTTWIPAEAFEFDFSDEVEEEIYECK